MAWRYRSFVMMARSIMFVFTCVIAVLVAVGIYPIRPAQPDLSAGAMLGASPRMTATLRPDRADALRVRG